MEVKLLILMNLTSHKLKKSQYSFVLYDLSQILRLQPEAEVNVRL